MIFGWLDERSESPTRHRNGGARHGPPHQVDLAERTCTGPRTPALQEAPGRGGHHAAWILLGALPVLALQASCHAALPPPEPIAVLTYRRPLSARPGAVDATLAFLTEDTIAFRFCTPFDWRTHARTCWLDVAALSGGDLQITAETETPEKPTWTKGVYAMANGAILLTSSTIQYLYSPDLKTRREIPMSFMAPPTPSNVVGRGEADLPNDRWSWTLYRLSPNLVPIRNGRGALYGVTDDYVMFFVDGTVRVETIGGRLLGLHRAEPGSGSYYIPEIIGPGRLYLGGKRPAIADFDGRELLRLRVPGGYGSDNRWSAGGGRMLFDHFIQTPTTLGELIDQCLGLPVPRGANGETIWVVDTSSAGACFEWDSPGQLLGQVGQRHADLSPSGRLLAAVTPTQLAVYRLPETCKSK